MDSIIVETAQDSVTTDTKPLRNTLITWLYRDADNYKTTRTAVLTGELDEAERREIRESLFEGEFLIPGQIGLADLQNSFEGCPAYWDPDTDHIFHELSMLEPTDLPATEPMSAAELLTAFRTARQEGWDMEYTPSFQEDLSRKWDMLQEEKKARGE